MTPFIMERPVMPQHIPVLCREVLAAFDFAEPATLVDGTVGLGGHTEALLRAYPSLKVIGVEWDAEAMALAQSRLSVFGPRFQSLSGNYADLPEGLADLGLAEVDGVLLDLGVSSLQLDHASRGFSFRKRGPLDMRMSMTSTHTAWDVIHQLDESALARVFATWGEERYARRAAAALKGALHQKRLPNDAWAVAECIRQAVPSSRTGVDSATRCFQGLRIAVNREIENLNRFLATMTRCVRSQGRIAILAYHSLEDRAVKTAFAQAVRGCICPPQSPACVCGKKPWGRLRSRKAIRPGDAEIDQNPRARSARLRILEKL